MPEIFLGREITKNKLDEQSLKFFSCLYRPIFSLVEYKTPQPSTMNY